MIPTNRTTPMRPIRAWLGALLLLGLLSGPATAAVAPQTMLESVTSEIIDVLKREQTTVQNEPAHMFTLVEQVLLPHVDMDVMSRYVLGKYWRRANEEQRERFRQEFKNLLVRFYASALLEDTDKLEQLLANSENLIKYLPVSVDDTTRKTTVRAEVNMPNGGPRVPVSFSLFRNTKGDWMMYDVNVDGISLVTNYRSSFAAEIKRDGLDALLDRLAERNRELLEEAKKKKTASSLTTPENDHRVI